MKSSKRHVILLSLFSCLNVNLNRFLLLLMVVNLPVFIFPLLHARDLLCFEEMRKTDYQSSFIQISDPNFDQFMFYLLQTVSC